MGIDPSFHFGCPHPRPCMSHAGSQLAERETDASRKQLPDMLSWTQHAERDVNNGIFVVPQSNTTCTAFVPLFCDLIAFLRRLQVRIL